MSCWAICHCQQQTNFQYGKKMPLWLIYVPDNNKTYAGLHVENLIFLSHPKPISCSLEDFHIGIQYQITLKKVLWKPHRNVRPDGHDATFRDTRTPLQSNCTEHATWILKPIQTRKICDGDISNRRSSSFIQKRRHWDSQWPGCCCARREILFSYGQKTVFGSWTHIWGA